MIWAMVRGTGIPKPTNPLKHLEPPKEKHSKRFWKGTTYLGSTLALGESRSNLDQTRAASPTCAYAGKKKNR